MDNLLFGFVTEDEKRKIKVKGETRIPAGRYRLVIRKVLSPLTKKYRERFYWFEYHIMLEGVDGFKYVYIHVGNYEHETDGCQLIGMSGNVEADGEFSNSRSVDAFERFYQLVYPQLKAGKEVYYTIKDEQKWAS